MDCGCELVRGESLVHALPLFHSPKQLPSMDLTCCLLQQHQRHLKAIAVETNPHLLRQLLLRRNQWHHPLLVAYHLGPRPTLGWQACNRPMPSPIATCPRTLLSHPVATWDAQGQRNKTRRPLVECPCDGTSLCGSRSRRSLFPDRLLKAYHICMHAIQLTTERGLDK
jgi:hypothetical protein